MYEITAKEIHQITAQVWSQLLGLPVKLVGARPFSGNSPSLACNVPLEGEWGGAVNLHVQAPIAKAMTARLYSLESEHVTHNAVLDAVGELTNQVGGLIKSKVAPQSLLAVPQVSESPKVVIALPGYNKIGIASMMCLDGMLSVSVWKQGNHR